MFWCFRHVGNLFDVVRPNTLVLSIDRFSMIKEKCLTKMEEQKMTLIRRNNHFFPSIWSDFMNDNWERTATDNKSVSIPAVNVKDNEDKFVVELAAPGLKKENIQINLENKLLTISAEEKSEKTEKDDNSDYTRKEFNYSSFSRSFTLPEIVESDNISASYQDGVLSITIPKAEKQKSSRLIEIG